MQILSKLSFIALALTEAQIQMEENSIYRKGQKNNGKQDLSALKESNLNWDEEERGYSGGYSDSNKPNNNDDKPTDPTLYSIEPGLIGDNRDNIGEIITMLLGSYWDGPNSEDLLNYGCWCNMRNGKDYATKGIGQPVDDIDAACQAWHRCTSCIRMDDTECTPISQNYSFLSGNSKYNQKVTCKKNKSDCSTWACECDVNLAETIVELVKSGTYDKKMTHSSNKFDSDSVCHWDGDFDIHDECCGVYPDRFPFASDFGARGCCGSSTYSTDTHDCCEGEDGDYEIKLSGKCFADSIYSSSDFLSLSSKNENPKHEFREIEVESESPEYYEIIAPYSVPEKEVVASNAYNHNVETVSEDDSRCSRSPANSEKQLEIILLVDISPSIAPQEESGLDGMFKYIQSLSKNFDFTENIKFSLITFAENAHVVINLDNFSSEEIVKKINNYQMYVELEVASDLNLGLKMARKEFKINGDEESDKVIVIISDGWSTSDNTPFFNANLATKEGIEIFALGYGPELNNEYLHISAMGNTDNIQKAEDIDELWENIHHLQNLICISDSEKTKENNFGWAQQRPDLDKKKYVKFALEYDRTQSIDANRVENVNSLFDQWIEDDYSIGFMGQRGLNFTSLYEY